MFDFLEFARENNVELRIEYFERVGVYQIIVTRNLCSAHVHISREEYDNLSYVIKHKMAILLKKLEEAELAGKLAAEKQWEIFKEINNIKD